jgi:hypothetical protein
VFLRLRQLCLVAQDLESTVEKLCQFLQLEVCHRDPAVAKFGLHNALLALGPGMLEVVAPTQAGTAAGRYLERRQGDGGYMVILDCDDLSRWPGHLAAQRVRVAAHLRHDAYEGLQLHPRDTGGALLEINHTEGNSADLLGPYWPAGSTWQAFAKPHHRLTGATLQSDHPETLALRWGEILQREVHRVDDHHFGAKWRGGAWSIPLDEGCLYFVPSQDQRGDGLIGVSLELPEFHPARHTQALIAGVVFDSRKTFIQSPPSS